VQSLAAGDSAAFETDIGWVILWVGSTLGLGWVGFDFLISRGRFLVPKIHTRGSNRTVTSVRLSSFHCSVVAEHNIPVIIITLTMQYSFSWVRYRFNTEAVLIPTAVVKITLMHGLVPVSGGSVLVRLWEVDHVHPRLNLLQRKIGQCLWSRSTSRTMQPSVCSSVTQDQLATIYWRR